LRPDTLPGDHAFTHTSGQSLVMQIATGHMTGSHMTVTCPCGYK